VSAKAAETGSAGTTRSTPSAAASPALPRTTKGASPAYLRIAASLRQRIQAGELTAHQALPAERDLCEDFAVSRMTARQALGVLESEGLVYRSSTRGTFVAAPRLQLRLGSFSYEVSRTGHQPGAQVLWTRTHTADEELATTFGLDVGTALHVLRRLRWADDEPIALETTYYPAAATPGLLEGDLSGSLWAQLRDRYDIRPTATSAKLEVVPLDAETSELLRSRQSAPGLQLTRHTYAADGTCLEYAEDLYRADRVAFTVDRALTED
jgi:GntR family transcriptional regulator